MIVSIVFAAVGLVILLGFVGSYFFRKTMVPDILWLLILGMMLGPMFNVIDPAMFSDFTPFFVSLSIMIILFQGGLQTNIYTLIKQSPRSILLMLLGIGFSMVTCSALAFYLLDWPILNGLLLGAILGGSSSPIVISITQRLPIGDNIKTLLNIESTLSDAFCIIISLVLIEIMTFGTFSASGVTSSLVGSFSIGATIGLVTGMIWVAGLSKLRRSEFEYMFILGILLILYAFVETINGSGAIAAFVFGVVIANSKEISNMIKMKKEAIVHSDIGRFHNEVSFLIRTFFFVYLGLIVTFTSLDIVLISLAFTSILMVMRFVAVHISTIKIDIPEKIKNNTKTVMGLLMPRGLAAAVMAQIPIMYGISHAEDYPSIVVGVIFMSILFTSAAIVLMKRRIRSIASKTPSRSRKK